MDIKKTALSSRIFAGFLLNGELKFFLQANHAFKQAILIEQAMQIIRFKGKEYVGFYLNEQSSLDKIAPLETKARELLQSFCPDKRVDKLKLTLFPELLIS